MFRNYLKIALRNLWRRKTFTATNVAGLAIAFGATLLLCLTAAYELSYDQFHEHKAQLYQLYREQHQPGKVEDKASFPIPFTAAFKSSFPGLSHITRYGDAGGDIIRYRQTELGLDTRTVDPDFLQMFSFNLEEGDPNHALDAVNNIVITHNLKEKIFGKDKTTAIGKIIEFKTDSGFKPYTVSAVTQDPPENSTLSFDALIRFENFTHYAQDKDSWGRSTHSVFVQLQPAVTYASLQEAGRRFVHTHYADEIKRLRENGASPSADGEYLRIEGVKAADWHFSNIATGTAVNKFYPYLLLLISGFILFIACVNFVNLSLGRAFTRTREVGMRKVMGAGRRQILLQFWGEALLLCIGSLAIGILLTRLCLPGYKTMFNQPISADIFRSPLFLTIITGAFLLVSLLAGGYPAWILSALDAATSVKGKLTVSKNNRLRNGLIIVQFTLSGLLVICTSIVWQQLNYMRKAPLGYNKQQVVSIPIGSHIEGQRALSIMRNRLAAVPGVVSVSGTDINLGRGRDGNSSTSQLGFEYKGRSISTNLLRVDYDYIRTLDIQLLKGRDFSRSFGSDTSAVIINEAMASIMGDKDPVGQVVAAGNDFPAMKVIGVVKDFHYKSLHRKIAPLTMDIMPGWEIGYIFVKLAPNDLDRSLHAVEKIWKEVNPKAESGISFLDENADKLYRKEARLSSIFISGALLAILVSCLGLFAVVVLVMGQRTREIGIRKILGASVTDIYSLVAKEFLQLVVIALIIAAPIAWWVMHTWLQDFAYRIHISIWVFLFSALMALIIALFTLSIQTLRAAWVNPIDNLRSE